MYKSLNLISGHSKRGESTRSGSSFSYSKNLELRQSSAKTASDSEGVPMGDTFQSSALASFGTTDLCDYPSR